MSVCFYFFLKALRILCELGRLPVFDLPRVLSLSRDSKNSKKLALEIGLFLVHLLPQATYQVPIKASIELCRCISQHGPAPEKKNKVFSAITEKVIKLLHWTLSAGKYTIPVLRVAHDLEIPFAHLGLGLYQLG